MRTHRVKGTTGSLAQEERRIRPSCKAKSPGDYSQIAFCIERQTVGLKRVQEFVDERGARPGGATPAAQILEKCLSESRDTYGHTDWSMTAFCVERQWDGSLARSTRAAGEGYQYTRAIR